MWDARKVLISVVFAGWAVGFAGQDRALGREIFVSEDGALRSIQEGVDAAGDGDTVLVGPGTYEIDKPIELNPAEGSARTFTLRSTDGPESTTIRMSDTPRDEEKATILIFQSTEGPDFVVEGFTLTNGGSWHWGTGDGHDGGGAVICLYGSSPTIRNCIMKENRGERGPGVFYAGGSSPTIEDCQFLDNIAYWWGGAAYCRDDSEAKFTRCQFLSNIALANGGAIYCYDNSRPVFRDCYFYSNCAESGGAVSSQLDTAPTMINCVMIGNRTHAFGGAVNSWGGFPTLKHCTISGNVSNWGGGVYQGKFDVEGELVGFLTMEDCLIWGNAGKSVWLPEGEELPDISYSCLEDLTCFEPTPENLEKFGPGNIHEDPRFGAWGLADEVWVDAAEPEGGDGSMDRPYRDLEEALTTFDYRLAQDSPCLGVGSEGSDIGASLDCPAYDLHLSTRCADAGTSHRKVHVAEGVYSIYGCSLAHRVSLEGAGRDETIIEGALYGLRTGTIASDFTVTKSFVGAIHLGTDENPDLVNLTITGNGFATHPISPNKYGGGVDCHGSSAHLTNCWIVGNWALNGGGLSCWGPARPVLTNCVIAGNYASSGGGVSLLYGADATFINCTIVSNVAEDGGAAFAVVDSNPSFINCILDGARRAEIPEGVEIDHCLFGEELGERSPFLHDGLFHFEDKDEDKAFVEVVRGVRSGLLPDFIVEMPDYRLVDGAEPIDSGTSDGAPIVDFDGKWRCDDPDVLNDEAGGDLPYYDVGAFENADSCPGLAFSAAETVAGSRVAVYVLLTSWAPVHGFSFGVVHDPTVATLVAMDTEGCDVWTEVEYLDLTSDPDADPSACNPTTSAGGTVDCIVTFADAGLEPCVDLPVVRLVYEISNDCGEAWRSSPRFVSCLESDGSPVPIQVQVEGSEVTPRLTEGELVCPGIGTLFRRGDSNDDRKVNLTDAVFILNHLFRGGPAPGCMDASDTNDDREVNLTDGIYLLNFLFLGGDQPPAPGPDECGPDLPIDELDCGSYVCGEGEGR